MKALALDLAWLALSYAAAVLVAVCVSVALMALPSFFPGLGMWQSFAAFREDVPGLLVFGMLITGLFGLPGFLIALRLAQRGSWSRVGQFAFAGCANTLLAIILFQIYMGAPVLPLSIYLPCFPGGYAGGVAYWFLRARYRAARPPYVLERSAR